MKKKEGGVYMTFRQDIIVRKLKLNLASEIEVYCD